MLNASYHVETTSLEINGDAKVTCAQPHQRFHSEELYYRVNCLLLPINGTMVSAAQWYDVTQISYCIGKATMVINKYDTYFVH